MSANYNDGSIPYGSEVITLQATTTATTGTVYIADNVNYSLPSKRIERTDQNDEPSGQVSYNGFASLTTTLQRATTSTPVPTRGYVASFLQPGGTSAWYYCDTVDTPEAKDKANEFNCTFFKKIN